MGIIGTVLVVLAIAVIGLIAFGILAIFARGMSDVPLGSKQNNQDKQNTK